MYLIMATPRKLRWTTSRQVNKNHWRLTSEFLEKETEVFLAPDVGLLVMIGSNLNNEKDSLNIKCGNRKCHFVILRGTDMIDTNKNEQSRGYSYCVLINLLYPMSWNGTYLCKAWRADQSLHLEKDTIKLINIIACMKFILKK